ncbi:MAG: clostripain-related cysteine peptidase [Candidatus Ozemobacteraceae bacterium]
MQKRSTSLAVLMIVLFSCSSIFAAPRVASHQPSSSRTTIRPPESVSAANSVKEWTFMVFMAADNNLEASSEGDLNEMETVGSSDQVNIVVELDRCGKYSQDTDMKWKGAKRFFMKKDDKPTHVSSQALQDLGEIDSSSPEALLDFVTWSRKNFPARRYALILWNHGTGWKEISPDGSNPVLRPGPESAISPFGHPRSTEANVPTYRTGLNPSLARAVGAISYNISYDDSSAGSMDIPTLGTTLAKVKGALGQPLDLIGFDACLMQMLEVTCETAPNALFQVGSTDLEPERGWPYDRILAGLVAAPQADGRKLGKSIVSFYNESYENGSQGNTAVVLSLIDLSKVSGFFTILNDFCSAVKQDIIEIDTIDQARQDSLKYVYQDYVDLAHFAELLQNRVASPRLKKAAGDLFDAVKTDAQNGLVSANANTGDKYKDAHGLSIFLPDHGGYRTYQKRYALLNLCKQTDWDGFLDEFEKPNLPYIRINEVTLEDQNRDGRITAGETVSTQLSLKNYGRKSISQMNLSWESTCKSISAKKNMVVLSQTPKPAQEITVKAFEFCVASDTPVNTEVTLNFKLTGEGVPASTFHTTFFVKPAFQTTGQVLLAFTDGFSPAPPVLQALFKDAGIRFDTWDRMLDGNLKPEVLKRYLDGWVFLSVQDSSDQQQLAKDEINALTDFLKGGGRLVFSGQDLAFSLRENPFLKDLCKIAFVQDDTNVHVISGIQTFLPGVTFQIYGGDGANNQKWPDEVDALPGGQIIMKFEAGARDIADHKGMTGPDLKPFSTSRGIKSTGSAGVAVVDGYRLLFFSFGIEAINANAQRLALLKQIKLFMTPGIDNQIRDFAGASSRRPRTRAPSARQYQDDVDMLAGMQKRIIRSIRTRMERDPKAAENSLKTIESLPPLARDAATDLERDVRSLLEFQRQHGTVAPK